MKLKNYFYELSKIIIFTISLLIALFITITSYVYYIDITDMSWCQDHPVLLLGIFFFAFLFINILSSQISKSPNSKKLNHILFGIVFSLIMLATVWWIINAQSLAQNDSKSLHDIAIRIIQNNDLSMITSKDSYMALCPHQSGILLYYELILRIIPNFNVVPMEALNWLYLALGLISGYLLMRKWFPEERTITCFSLLLLFCWPWFFYVNFAYGEMPGICLMIFTTYMLTLYLEQPKWYYLVLTLLGTLLATLLRRNHIIFIIAVILILLVMCFEKYKKQYIFTIAGLIIASAFACIFPQKFYEARANDVMGSGIPATSYIAMGLQETEGISPGWNNGFHSQTLMENGYDTELAKEISKQSIQESLTYMLQNPGYACNFFFRKLVPEWCDQNYSCLYSTSMMYYNRTEAAHKIYNGSWTNTILHIMNVYQSILYTGFLLFCLRSAIHRVRNRRLVSKADHSPHALWKLVWMVTIIGGFLFCAIWEGGSRYTLPYIVCMLPYAACGITHYKKPSEN